MSQQIIDDISCEGLVCKEQLKTRTTVHFTSDGTYIYWLYTVTPPETAGKNDKDKSDKIIQELVYLETIVVKVSFSDVQRVNEVMWYIGRW